MKYVLLLTVALIALSTQVRAQADGLTDAQWLPLFQALEGEDWDTAERLSSKYLDEVISASSNDRTLARLRYMYLYSAAGKISAGKMTYDDLEKRIKAFAGKEIFLPARYLVEKCRAGVDFNGLCKSDGDHDIMVTSANRAGTTIHAFEYIKLKDKLDWSKNGGKVAAILGTIESIAPNPNKSRVLIMRIFVIDGVIQLRDEPKK
jgi:hypothetical protein